MMWNECIQKYIKFMLLHCVDNTMSKCMLSPEVSGKELEAAEGHSSSFSSAPLSPATTAQSHVRISILGGKI